MPLGDSAILAGGLSMTPEVVTAVRDAGIRSIVINGSWKLMPDADCLMACDSSWWLTRFPRLSPTPDEFKGERIYCKENMPVLGATYYAPHPIAKGTMMGSNSALQAAYREIKLGAKRILLFGVDLRDDELTHHYGNYGGTLNNPTKMRFGRARKAWQDFAAETDRPEVINCSLRSALECFPKMTMEVALGLS